MGESGPVLFSELFGKKQTLAVYSYLYGPQRKPPRPMCTSLMSAWDGEALDVEQRIALVIVARSPIERLLELKKERGWRNLKLHSDGDGDFTRNDVSAADEDMPAFNVFTRRDSGIRHFRSGEMGGSTADPGQNSRGAPDLMPLWTILDSASVFPLRKIAKMTNAVQLRAAMLASISILTIASAVGAPTLPVARPFDPVAIDSFIITQMARHRIPGLALAVTHGDEVVFVRGYGEARDGEPVTGQTQFRIASLSKAFTALAVLQLVDAGRIQLDAPVAHYLPHFALATRSDAARITVRQLLNQTSGLADAGFLNGLCGQHQMLADRVASLHTARAVDPPGKAFHYFDPNYQVLARLAEVVSGEPFDGYLRQHVFAPLDMRSTISSFTSVLPAESSHLLAQGHVVVYGLPVALPELSGFLGGSGGVVSTASDMANHLIAQANHGRYLGSSVLSAKGVSLMQTPTAGVASNYAMGWTTSNANGTQTIEHNGVLSTFYADTVLLPQSEYGFVLLYNAYAVTASTQAFPEMKNGMVALLMGHTPVIGEITLPWLGRVLAAISAVIVGLFTWNLLQLPQWKVWAATAPRAKLGWSLIWPLAPALFLLGLPRLFALTTGRYFDHVMLTRALPELVILLGICGALGLGNAVARFRLLARLRVSSVRQRTDETRPMPSTKAI